MAIDKDNFGFYNFLAIDVFFTSILIFFISTLESIRAE